MTSSKGGKDVHFKTCHLGHRLFCGFFGLGLICLALVAWGVIPGQLWAAGGITLALCVSIAVGVVSQKAGFFACPITQAAFQSRKLALTFDDGPDETYTPLILKLLAQSRQRATFFVIGDKVQAHPELARQIVRAGHDIANHTVSHPWHLALWPARRIARHLCHASEQIFQATGVMPQFFRPPAAVLSPRIAKGALLAGLHLVGYSVRAGDGSTLVSSKGALGRLLKGLNGGAILLLHDAALKGMAPTAMEIMPPLLEELQRRGFQSVPLSELLAHSESDKNNGARSA